MKAFLLFFFIFTSNILKAEDVIDRDRAFSNLTAWNNIQNNLIYSNVMNNGAIGALSVITDVSLYSSIYVKVTFSSGAGNVTPLWGDGSTFSTGTWISSAPIKNGFDVLYKKARYLAFRNTAGTAVNNASIYISGQSGSGAASSPVFNSFSPYTSIVTNVTSSANTTWALINVSSSAGISCANGCDIIFDNQGSDVMGWSIGTSNPNSSDLGFPLAVSATPVGIQSLGPGAILYYRAQTGNATIRYSIFGKQ